MRISLKKMTQTRPDKTVLPVDKPAEKSKNTKLRGKSFAFSGKIANTTRTELKRKLHGLGAIYHHNIVKTTDYLVLGTKPGKSKVRLATHYRTRRITTTEFENLTSQ